MHLMESKRLEEGNPDFKAQFMAVQNQRALGYRGQELIVDQYGEVMDPHQMRVNAADQFAPDWWADIDRRAIQVRDNDKGRELLTDLMKLSTSVNIGYTFKTYGTGADIDDEVKISMDGNIPMVYDHIDTESEGDPIPIFQTGFGINWRKWMGHRNANLDTVGQSQTLKLRDMFEAMVDYVLDGSDKVNVNGKPGQGIRTHRNTKKIDLTVAGIDLTSGATSNDDILNFWNQTFALHLDANYINGKISVVWVSPEIERRMVVPFNNAQGFKGGTLKQAILDFARVGEFQTTYKLKGNEFLAYERSQEAISPLVGQVVGTVPVERRAPKDNFNFEIWGAMGLQIKADANGRSSVLYAAKLT